jgi:hypothetical protein
MRRRGLEMAGRWREGEMETESGRSRRGEVFDGCGELWVVVVVVVVELKIMILRRLFGDPCSKSRAAAFG